MADDPDFRFYASFRDNPKRVELECALGAKGLVALVDLWCWVRVTRPTGDLTGLSDAAIERGAGWRGARGALVKALRAGWLDGEPGAFTVHGWGDRQGWAKASPARSRAGKVAAIVKQAKRHGVTTDQWLNDVGGEDAKNDALREAARAASQKSTKGGTNRSRSLNDQRNDHHESLPLVSTPSPSPTPTPSPTGRGREAVGATDVHPSAPAAHPPQPEKPPAPPRCARCKDLGQIGNPKVLARYHAGGRIRPRGGIVEPFMVPCPECGPKAPEGKEGSEEPAERGYATTSKAVGISAPRSAGRAVRFPPGRLPAVSA